MSVIDHTLYVRPCLHVAAAPPMIQSMRDSSIVHGFLYGYRLREVARRVSIMRMLQCALAGQCACRFSVAIIRTVCTEIIRRHTSTKHVPFFFSNCIRSDDTELNVCVMCPCVLVMGSVSSTSNRIMRRVLNVQYTILHARLLTSISVDRNRSLIAQMHTRSHICNSSTTQQHHRVVINRRTSQHPDYCMIQPLKYIACAFVCTLWIYRTRGLQLNVGCDACVHTNGSHMCSALNSI